MLSARTVQQNSGNRFKGRNWKKCSRAHHVDHLYARGLKHCGNSGCNDRWSLHSRLGRGTDSTKKKKERRIAGNGLSTFKCSRKAIATPLKTLKTLFSLPKAKRVLSGHCSAREIDRCLGHFYGFLFERLGTG